VRAAGFSRRPKEKQAVTNDRWIGAPLGVCAILGAFALALLLASAPAAAARCDRADARLAKTGKGDKDGDGISNCRERRMRTAVDDPDSDADGMDDGAELADGCDPLDSDSDDDGIPDGEDDSPAPAPTQKVKAFVDALSCPGEGAAGSLTALGIVVALDEATEFEDETCAELAARFEAEGSAFVEIEIAEDEAGGLTATEVEAEDHDGHHDGDHDGDDDGDEDGEGDDEDGGDDD
jgi:hypothetical protein